MSSGSGDVQGSTEDATAFFYLALVEANEGEVSQDVGALAAERRVKRHKRRFEKLLGLAYLPEAYKTSTVEALSSGIIKDLVCREVAAFAFF